MQLVWKRSSFVSLFLFALDPLWRLFCFFLFLSSIDEPCESSRVAWVDVEPAFACFVPGIVWRRGAGHSWRTQDGDGRQGSKVWGGLVGRTWLCYSYHKLLRLPGGWFVLRLACHFPLVLSLTLLITSRVLFFSLFFSSVCHIPCGKARQFFLLCFPFSLLICFLSFCFSLFSLVHRMCMSCLPYPVRMAAWYCIVYGAYCIPGT